MLRKHAIDIIGTLVIIVGVIIIFFTWPSKPTVVIEGNAKTPRDTICVHMECYIVSQDGYTCYVDSREFAKMKSYMDAHAIIPLREKYECKNGWQK